MSPSLARRYNARLMKQVDLPYFTPIIRYKGLIDLTNQDRQERFEAEIAAYTRTQKGYEDLIELI